MSIAFIPYSCQQINQDDIDAVVSVLRSEFLTQGPVLPDFERAFSSRHDVPHAVAVSNATAGLHIACLALGVGPGDVVWTSPNSFLASANCARYCGADVDFVDIDPGTRNMSVDALSEKLERVRTDGRLPKVVVPVDFAGVPADLREMRSLADRYGFRILEDASHATGASYLGRPAGSRWADISVFSFHAVKVLTTAEGGMLVTRDAQLADQLRLLRSHGMTRDARQMQDGPEGSWAYQQVLLGHNMRMSDIQAALGLSQLSRLDAMHSARCLLADRYDRLLADLPLRLPPRFDDRVSAWHLYAVELDPQRSRVRRGDLFATMRAAGVGVQVHYIPIHTQPYYLRLGFRAGDFPHSEAYYAQAISLPLFPSMTHKQQDRVVQILRAALTC
jgi:UDP-4-amino-4,6-dideoxy-N-acetyl-beta-L-altrosamine transaminase